MTTFKIIKKLGHETRAKELITLVYLSTADIVESNGWKISSIREFYPKDPTVFCHRKDSVIRVRMRSSHDSDKFLSLESIVEIMLREICNFEIDSEFRKLLGKIVQGYKYMYTAPKRIDVQKCCVCIEKYSNIVIVPCGHLITCFDCSSELDNCPICRVKITDTVVLYA
jgi:hypothetical protein